MPEASGTAIVHPPPAVNGTVRNRVRKAPPRRQTNASKRAREYLTPAEVEQLLQAARSRGRYGARDAAMILIAYRHGLRVAELVGLRWAQVDFGAGLLHVHRVKRGTPSVHPLRAPELRALRAMSRAGSSAYVFTTERGAPMTAAGFRKLLARTGAAAGLELAVHPHMLRHGCGFKLANDGHDTRAIQHYLGHKNIAHTVRYTELSPQRFQLFWND
jgi:type 1 fimbriae regulatory protein FimB/type 1 fimbriae regulatory protein FimE